MTIYKTKSGEEVVVCDDCGRTEDHLHPDMSQLTKVDLTAEMLAAGFPQGTELNVKDQCPACTRSVGEGLDSPSRQ